MGTRITMGVGALALASIALGGCTGSPGVASPSASLASTKSSFATTTPPTPQGSSSGSVAWTFSVPPSAPPSSPTSRPTDPTTARTLALLAKLPVKGRAPKTGYDRKQFGVRWSDDVDVSLGHNGCDTRNDILRRDLSDITLKPIAHGCIVLTGVLVDPYTGTRISFHRGVGTSNAIQIDHVVALSDAWQKGAQQLSPEQRQDFANDPRNLLAVSGRANDQKRDGDAATWLPKNKSYRCTYVAKQVAVKSAYHLWVTKSEKEAITRVLGKCG
ncbi:HNH endonuclease family protein [Flexivirga alba]|uniref:HNH endonuclease family protein n=1 Tax=Flexivirga alba TaxID=702742 RepID=A0ABW2AHD8_9MICO